MVVCLSQRRAVAREDLLALAVRREHGLIDLRCGMFKPGEQRRANVEADPGIVVDDLDDAALAVQDPGGGVGRVAFGGDPLVPVVIGRGRILQLDRLQPGILPRGLVEVAMNANVAFHRRFLGSGEEDKGLGMSTTRSLAEALSTESVSDNTSRTLRVCRQRMPLRCPTSGHNMALKCAQRPTRPLRFAEATVQLTMPYSWHPSHFRAPHETLTYLALQPTA